MRYRKKMLIRAAIVLAVVACFVGYIQFFNGTLIYISTGLGKNKIVQVKNQSTQMMQANILLADAKAEYEEVFGSDVWSKEIEGRSFEEYAKEQVKAKLIRVRCMNVYAKKRGVVLSRAEKESVEKAAKDYMAGLTKEQKDAAGITEEKVQTMFTEFAIAKTLYDDMTASVNREISSDDARVITVQYIACDNEADIKEAYRSVQAGDIFYTVATKYNGDAGYEAELRRGDMDEAFEKAAFNLKNGEVSGIVNAQDKYYIIKCVSDNEKAKTEANKASMIEDEKLAYFNEQFTQYESSVYVDFNKRAWKKKKMNQVVSLDRSFEDVFDSYFQK